MTKALILGGSGFVGGRLVQALLRDGSEVSLLNRGVTADLFGDRVERLVADRTDRVALQAALSGRSWDAVYDVSGFVMAAGGADIDDLLNLLDGSTQRYIYVSSIMAYDQGLVGVFPWTEDMPTNADSASGYGGFKGAAERAILKRFAATGFPATIVRPAAIYGPENNIFDMELPMFLRLLQNRPILMPHGGLVVGSYGHVDDLCAAMMVMANHPAAMGEVFNITGSSCDTATYVATLARVVGADPKIVSVPDHRLDDFTTPVFGHLFKRRHHAMLSTEKASRMLGIVAEFDLYAGHMHTYQWFQAQGFDALTDARSDPLWKVSWDFVAEAEAAASLTAHLTPRSGVDHG
jgi:nucleoside-diphosphate-sugar epimerase